MTKNSVLTAQMKGKRRRTQCNILSLKEKHVKISEFEIFFTKILFEVVLLA